MNAQHKEATDPATQHTSDREPLATPFQITLAVLKGLPEEFNQAIRLDHELTLLETSGRLPLMTLISMRPRMERAYKIGAQEIERVRESLNILRKLEAQPREDQPPVGF